MSLTIEDLRQHESGVVIDITLIGLDSSMGKMVMRAGETFRVTFDRVTTEMMPADQRGDIGEGIQRLLVDMVWGRAMLEDLPSTVSIPPLPEGADPDQIMLGMHDWMIERIELVEDS